MTTIEGDEKMIKEHHEIEKMQQAQRVADRAFEYILPHIKIGAREVDIADKIYKFFEKEGVLPLAFDTIVVSGVRGCLPHGEPTEKAFEYGEFITLDFGCTFEGYCSDMTRTVAVGAVSSEQLYIYETVLAAQVVAIEYIKAGISCFDADKVARDIISEAKKFRPDGYGEFFVHTLGHGVGREVHEEPRLSSKSEDILQTNMVVTVEPGIYIPDWGGVRIEDMVWVRDDGVVNLTKAPKELMVL
ncbi:MAG: aminopeptidase P family protein [Oscillospiraceae bacterium]|nr:aminopeptidase P family protein [Oscillospiraceae bacterium]